jgi:hypothetical protein
MPSRPVLRPSDFRSLHLRSNLLAHLLSLDTTLCTPHDRYRRTSVRNPDETQAIGFTSDGAETFAIERSEKADQEIQPQEKELESIIPRFEIR